MFITVFVYFVASAALWGAQVAPSSDDWRDLMDQGNALHALGRCTEAAHVFQQALATLKASRGSQLQFVENFESLGSVYADAGMMTRAYDEYQRALKGIADSEGLDSLDYAVVFAMAVDLLQPAEVGKECVAKLRDALARYGTTGSPDKLTTIRISLAHIFWKKKKLGDAEPLLLDALADITKRPVKTPKAKADVLNAVAVLRFEQRHYDESLAVNLEYVRYLEERLGSNHPMLVVAWNNVGSVYIKLGRFSDALIAYETAISVANAALEPNDPARYPLALNYGFVLRKAGRKAEARIYDRKASEIKRNLARLDGFGLTVSATALRSRE